MKSLSTQTCQYEVLLIFFLTWLQDVKEKGMSKKKKGFRRRQFTIFSPIIPARSIQRKQRTDSEMLAAIEDVKQGMSCNHAVYTHGVPRSTVKLHISGRVIHGRNPGPVRYLSSEEEALWLIIYRNLPIWGTAKLSLMYVVLWNPT